MLQVIIAVSILTLIIILWVMISLINEITRELIRQKGLLFKIIEYLEKSTERKKSSDGKEKDEPEGARYIQISDILAKILAKELQNLKSIQKDF